LIEVDITFAGITPRETTGALGERRVLARRDGRVITGARIGATRKPEGDEILNISPEKGWRDGMETQVAMAAKARGLPPFQPGGGEEAGRCSLDARTM